MGESVTGYLDHRYIKRNFNSNSSEIPNYNEKNINISQRDRV